MVRTAAVALLTVMCAGASALAAEGSDEQHRAAVEQSAGSADATPIGLTSARNVASAQRPTVLPALYASFAGLQIYDGYSTMTGRTFGAREVNPAMRWMAANPIGMWSVKAATTTLVIAAGERMWKRNKAAAILAMTAANGVAVAVAARNASVLRQLR